MSEPQAQPQSEPPISTNPRESGNANLIYILFLAGLVTGGLATIVGVVMAYMAKDDTTDTLRTHYINQINLFWKSLLYGLICIVLTFILIGLILALAVFVWYIVRIVKGMQSLSKGEAIANPGSWGL